MTAQGDTNLPPSIAEAVAEATKPASPDFDALLDEVRADPEGPKGATFQLKGREFRILSPLDWSDDMLIKQREAAAAPDKADVVGLAIDFLGGVDEYAEFTARGGTAMRLQSVLPKLMGSSLGESSAS